MKKLMFVMMCLMVSFVSVQAGSAPRIVQCGVEPGTVMPGDTFILYADVADADGFSDISHVALLVDGRPVFQLPQSETDPSRFVQSFEMPENVTPATFTLSLAAWDADNLSSQATYFTFSIGEDSPAVQLVSPEDGQVVDCHGMTVFEWMPFDSSIAGYVFALDLIDGNRITVNLPAGFTSIPVPGQLWSMLPDGQYFWQVGVFSKESAEPYAWSEIRSFYVECGSQFPSEVFGEVVEKDEAAGTFLLRTRECPHHHGEVLIQVTDETIILDADGQSVTFDAIEIGMRLLATGAFDGDVFVAQEIHLAHHHHPPSGDRVAGDVVAVNLDTQTILIHSADRAVDLTVYVTEETIIIGPEGPMELDAIRIGDHLLAEGLWEGEMFIAVHVRIHTDEPPHGEEDSVIGLIADIYPDTMQITIAPSHNSPEEVLVQVTDTTRILSHHGPMSFDDLESGQEVIAVGHYENELLIAEEIMVRDHHEPPDPPSDHVFGTVVTIDVAALSCEITCENGNGPGRIVVQATEDTRVMNRMEPAAFADIEVGMNIFVQGEMNENVIFAEVICIQQ